jgi:hypothetical protein
MKQLKLKDLKIGSLVQPTEFSLWFPISNDTIDVIYIKDDNDFGEELFKDFVRIPLIYMGKNIKKKFNKNIDPVFRGKHKVLFGNKVYYVVPEAWKRIKEI